MIVTCRTLQVPKPPRKDFYKLMNKDKIVLRFSTRFVETPTHQLSSSDRSATQQLAESAVEQLIGAQQSTQQSCILSSSAQ